MLRETYQVGIQTVETMSCVGVVVNLCFLTSDEIHDLVLTFTWCLRIHQHHNSSTENSLREIQRFSYKLQIQVDKLYKRNLTAKEILNFVAFALSVTKSRPLSYIDFHQCMLLSNQELFSHHNKLFKKHVCMRHMLSTTQTVHSNNKVAKHTLQCFTMALHKYLTKLMQQFTSWPERQILGPCQRRSVETFFTTKYCSASWSLAINSVPTDQQHNISKEQNKAFNLTTV